MKRFTPYLIGALATLVLLATFSLGQASARALAATGCFSDTNSHWAEAAICWAASNGVVGGFPDGTYKPNNTVTRAQVAVMLKNQVNIPPEAGEHRVNVDPSDWVVNAATTNSYIQYYTTTAYLRASATGVKGFQVGVPAPSRVYGRNSMLKGVTLCYSTDANTTLDLVSLQLWASSTGGSGSLVAAANDSTDRTDSACRVYNLSSPMILLSGDHVNLFILVNFATTGGIFSVSSTTFTFDPYAPASLGPEPLRPELPGLEAVPGGAPGQ